MNKWCVAGLAGAALLSAGIGAANAKPQYYMTVVPATSEAGVDTGVSFNAGQTVTVKAQGYISVTSTQPQPFKPQSAGSEGFFSPDGALGANGSATDPDCQLGQLIGTIAGTGTWHCLGKSASFVADGTGDLLLSINDWPGNYGDNLGDFEAAILAP